MKVGIGLPAVIPGASGELVMDWASRADAGPFSTLGLIDRVIYSNYEPMVTLAAAAGATCRIRLMTSVLLVPLRSAVLLAKEAASLNELSGGRFTLGLGVGGRIVKEDFNAVGASFHDRGKRMDDILRTMRRIWAGEVPPGGSEPVGPPISKGEPEVLIGGYRPVALRRAARWGDGFLAAPATPRDTQAQYAMVMDFWKQEGRSGQPRFVSGMYYGLGPNAAQRADDYIRHFYAFLGPAAGEIAASVRSSDKAVRDALRAFSEIGVDEMILWPCIAELDQLDRLADLVG